MIFRVLHHDHCFDGACSAAVFTKFHRECIGGADGYEYRGLQHAAGGGDGEKIFGAGENAIVDFRYSTSPKMTWWFDHHQSAFRSAEDRAHFEAGQAGEFAERQFFDPRSISCTSLIATVTRNRFGFNTAGLEDLLYWADIIDGARFESAKAAVEMEAPALQLAMVIENSGESDLISRVIPMLTEMSFGQVVQQPLVQDRVMPLMEKHQASMKLIYERAELKDGVIYFDVTDKPMEGLSKFIPYYYYPEATYTVALSRSSHRVKISVGTNPWTHLPEEDLVNLAEICERYGGGGHARVGAISLPPDTENRGRATAAKIVEELREAEMRR